ncbi:MAG: YdcF family protein [Acidimicrobiales bacterium]
MILGPLKLFLRLVSLVLSIVIVYLAVGFVQVWLTGREHSTTRSQAILVLGTTEDNGKPSAELAARLTAALVLYHDRRAPWIVVTGGKLAGDNYTEAGVSATYLEARGVPRARIIVGSGNDTWQNVASVIPAMRAHDLVTVLCVTDPFHEYRAMAIASDQGLTPHPAPVANAPSSHGSLWYYYFRETLAVGLGRLIGYHTLSTWTTRGTQVTLPPSGP